MLNPLTSLRFFAALAVLLLHVELFEEGFLGVSFFYVLSGFILTFNYHNCFGSLNNKDILNFYVARWARIYPVHFLTFLLSFPLLYNAIIENHSMSIIIKGLLNISLLHSFIPIQDFYTSFNYVSWSLSDELFFYITLVTVK